MSVRFECESYGEDKQCLQSVGVSSYSVQDGSVLSRSENVIPNSSVWNDRFEKSERDGCDIETLSGIPSVGSIV